MSLYVLFISQVRFLPRDLCSTWWDRRRQLSCRTVWLSVRRWTTPYRTTSSNRPTTHTWQVAPSRGSTFESEHLGLGLFSDCWHFVCLSPPVQLVSSPACPLRRCTASACCRAAAVWSWTAGRANPQMKSPSSPTASPWQLRSSSRWLFVILFFLLTPSHVMSSLNVSECVLVIVRHDSRVFSSKRLCKLYFPVSIPTCGWQLKNESGVLINVHIH